MIWKERQYEARGMKKKWYQKSRKMVTPLQGDRATSHTDHGNRYTPAACRSWHFVDFCIVSCHNYKPARLI